MESQVNEDSRSIKFQPSEIPNIEFSYNQEEYQFELTWKSYYLNIKPFAIYRDQRYELKQIIPFLKNQYPNIEYRTAINKFKNYQRWGFWLEKLPQNIADNLDYLGFELDYNIPLRVIEIEELEGGNFTFKRIHIANKLTLDFYDLYERGFSVEINKTTILIGNVKGKTDLDLDPITYSAPTITVIGFNETVPCTSWEIWNASNVNGWDVVHNNNNTNTQFEFDCKLVIGDGVNATWFTDKDTQLIFADGIISANYEKIIHAMSYARFTLGNMRDATDKISNQGCSLVFLESTYQPLVQLGTWGYYYIYSSHIKADKNVNLYFTTAVGRGRVWNCLLENTTFSRYSVCDLYNVIITDAGLNFCIRTSSRLLMERVSIFHSTLYVFESTSNIAFSVRNAVIRDIVTLVQVAWQNTDGYMIDIDSDTWTFVFGNSDGEIYRQYSFNLKVVLENGTGLKDANVTLTYEGQDGGEFGSWITPTNGSIPEQIISKGFYNQTGDDTIYPYEPYTLTITATDYRTHTFIFNLSEPIRWTVPLARARVIESDAPWIALAIILSIIAFLLATRIKR